MEPPERDTAIRGLIEHTRKWFENEHGRPMNKEEREEQELRLAEMETWHIQMCWMALFGSWPKEDG